MILGSGYRTGFAVALPLQPIVRVAIGLATAAALAAGAAHATDAFVWDQGSANFGSGVGISDWVGADDFVLPADGQIEFLDMWLGVITSQDDFSGTMSWAVMDDDAGTPGALVASGTDASPAVLWRDEYYSRVRLRFASPVVLLAGTYWIALHEGAWLSPFDGSSSIWILGDLSYGAITRYATDETNPTSWSTGTGDRTFVLYGTFADATDGELVFASGFEAGTTCAWDEPAFGATCN